MAVKNTSSQAFHGGKAVEETGEKKRIGRRRQRSRSNECEKEDEGNDCNSKDVTFQ